MLLSVLTVRSQRSQGACNSQLQLGTFSHFTPNTFTQHLWAIWHMEVNSILEDNSCYMQLFSLKKKRLQWDLIYIYKYINGCDLSTVMMRRQAIGDYPTGWGLGKDRIVAFLLSLWCDESCHLPFLLWQHLSQRGPNALPTDWRAIFSW